jgi:hypothetical protein
LYPNNTACNVNIILTRGRITVLQKQLNFISAVPAPILSLRNYFLEGAGTYTFFERFLLLSWHLYFDTMDNPEYFNYAAPHVYSLVTVHLPQG